MEAKRKLTFGEKRVRVGFNPSKDNKIDVLKQTMADSIDSIQQAKSKTSGTIVHPEKLRLISLAQTAMEEAASWGTKALTFNEEEWL